MNNIANNVKEWYVVIINMKTPCMDSYYAPYIDTIVLTIFCLKEELFSKVVHEFFIANFRRTNAFCGPELKDVFIKKLSLDGNIFNEEEDSKKMSQFLEKSLEFMRYIFQEIDEVKDLGPLNYFFQSDSFKECVSVGTVEEELDEEASKYGQMNFSFSLYRPTFDTAPVFVGSFYEDGKADLVSNMNH